MKTIQFRNACEDDLDRLIAIHTCAFPDERGPDARRRNFVRNTLGDLDALVVASQDGNIVAHAFLFEGMRWFGGARVRAAAIASLGVAPECRGTGVASLLLEELHSRALSLGVPLAFLYPSRQGFYAARGYVPVSSSRRLIFSPHSIPRAIPRNSRASTAPSEQTCIRPAMASDRVPLVHLYERVGAVSTGVLVRSERMWDAQLLDETRQWFVIERANEIVGYIAFSLTLSAGHLVTMKVHDLIAADVHARMRLLGFVGGQRDQVSDVVMDVDAHDPLDAVLTDADLARRGSGGMEHTIGEVIAGPMMRVLHLEHALSERGYRANVDVRISFDEDEDEEPIRISVEDGRARVQRTSERNDFDVRMSRSTLGRIAFGGMRVHDAARLGLVWADDEALDRVDVLFGGPAFFSTDTF